MDELKHNHNVLIGADRNVSDVESNKRTARGRRRSQGVGSIVGVTGKQPHHRIATGVGHRRRQIHLIGAVSLSCEWPDVQSRSIGQVGVDGGVGHRMARRVLHVHGHLLCGYGDVRYGVRRKRESIHIQSEVSRRVESSRVVVAVESQCVITGRNLERIGAGVVAHHANLAASTACWQVELHAAQPVAETVLYPAAQSSDAGRDQNKIQSRIAADYSIQRDGRLEAAAGWRCYSYVVCSTGYGQCVIASWISCRVRDHRAVAQVDNLNSGANERRARLILYRAWNLENAGGYDAN